METLSGDSLTSEMQLSFLFLTPFSMGSALKKKMAVLELTFFGFHRPEKQTESHKKFVKMAEKYGGLSI